VQLQVFRLTDANKDTSVNVSAALATKAEEKMKQKGFTTLESYVAHLLRKDTEDHTLDEAAVKERLRSLGYLD